MTVSLDHATARLFYWVRFAYNELTACYWFAICTQIFFSAGYTLTESDSCLSSFARCCSHFALPF